MGLGVAPFEGDPATFHVFALSFVHFYNFVSSFFLSI